MMRYLNFFLRFLVAFLVTSFVFVGLFWLQDSPPGYPWPAVFILAIIAGIASVWAKYRPDFEAAYRRTYGYASTGVVWFRDHLGVQASYVAWWFPFIGLLFGYGIAPLRTLLSPYFWLAQFGIWVINTWLLPHVTLMQSRARKPLIVAWGGVILLNLGLWAEKVLGTGWQPVSQYFSTTRMLVEQTGELISEVFGLVPYGQVNDPALESWIIWTVAGIIILLLVRNFLSTSSPTPPPAPAGRKKISLGWILIILIAVGIIVGSFYINDIGSAWDRYQLKKNYPHAIIP